MKPVQKPQKHSIKKIRLYAAFAPAIMVLTACSGHPGAGAWNNINAQNGDIERAEIKYDGYANLYLKDEVEAKYHCFWQAESAQTIQLQCASQQKSDLYYKLEVDAQNRLHSTLIRPDEPNLSLERTGPAT